ncbi:DNA-binding response regulator, OmpR family, contains REC and winged-helix (wHTH) domain [Flexibacter flexilis DSM 6793]|uniref:DNA-binding response regulator, OmpR family, contains REC and winged-helix (WHTH) domain n=1 Tax=Flexibacter flexilis DSM 6793 TaxID=927664 RepID=A0A1I1DSK7_9BACT|nr:response regulator transcription factor [Flexibacter flexilis]SFB77834.1 DNA-binding response regulator, OmpR family, contains REC and winged-helix (wHTH) domain [Flexibacter flexilis DSM 6793]
MKKILLAEDDPNLGQILQEYLTVKGFEAVLCRDGEIALQAFAKQQPFDLCILDVMMPKKDGFTLCADIRKINATIPVIFLTARSQSKDAIEGFQAGADDYVAKPFSMEELLLRINAILRRSTSAVGNGQENKTTNENQFIIGSMAFDYQTQTLKSQTQTHKLTSKEAELLKLLCQNQNQTLERGTALKHIWHDDSYYNARSMDVYITKLRKYLRDDTNVEIVNVHGTGFKLLVTNTI